MVHASQTNTIIHEDKASLKDLFVSQISRISTLKTKKQTPAILPKSYLTRFTNKKSLKSLVEHFIRLLSLSREMSLLSDATTKVLLEDKDLKKYPLKYNLKIRST